MERIVDQVVNPKIASVFIPQVEDLVYNYLGITRKKSASSETSIEKPTIDLLPTDLEAVSPGSVKSNDDKPDDIEMETKEEPMDVDEDIHETKIEDNSSSSSESGKEKEKPAVQDVAIPGVSESTGDSVISIDKSSIPLPEEMKPENIPPPENSPPKLDLNKIELPKTPEEYTHLPQNPTEIPLPTDGPIENEHCFKPINTNSDNDDSSSDSSLRRNMSPLTPVRNFNTENSCDAQQGFDNDSDAKTDTKEEPSTFRFAIESKTSEVDSVESNKKKKDSEQVSLAYQFNNQVNINTLNTPFYEDSSNSNNLQIDYESDANSKTNVENKVHGVENSEDAKKERKTDDRRSSHKSSHRSRDSHRHSSSKDKKSNSKQSSSRDSSRHDKKSKDDHSKSKSSHKEGDRSRDKSERKDSRDSSKHRSSHRSSSSQKDSKSNRSSSSSQRSSSKQSDDKKSSSTSNRDKNERSSDKSKDKKDNKYGPQDSKSSSQRSEKDKKSGSKSKHDDKDKKRGKKETDDHYSLSGRGNSNRRSTDRDSNDGSSSSKGSNNPTSSKSSEGKKENKGSSSKSDNTSSSDSTSPSDKEQKVTNVGNDATNVPTVKPIVRVETQLEVPIASPPRLPFVPDITLKKPKFAANLEEAKKMMKMRKFLDEEQKRMNQEAALLLEFQANVRPSLSQAYSSISGPELEFACVTNLSQTAVDDQNRYEIVKMSNPEDQNDEFQDQTQDMIIEKDPSEAGNASNINDQIEGACLNNETIDSRFLQTDIEERTVEHCEVANETLDNSIDQNINENETDDQQVSEKKGETYEENKPFSQLVDEITEYSKASERLKLTDKPNADVTETANRSGLFEVTIITEELSENEDIVDTNIETKVTEQVVEECPEEELLHYFAEHEKYDAELKKHVYSSFLRKINETLTSTATMFLVNCDTYEENIFREVCQSFGQFEIVNYFKNGNLKLPTAKNVKDFDLEAEIALPVEKAYQMPMPRPAVFSPVKSECSFDLSNDYDARLEEMVNRTSKQEIMEIILGGVIDESSNAMPTIDYCKESNIISEITLKRKANDMEVSVNNNGHILTQNKIRKLSESDQISSTTEGNLMIFNRFVFNCNL